MKEKLFTRYNRANLMVMAFLFVFTGVIYYVIVSSVLVHEVDEALKKYQKQVGRYVGQNDSLPVFKNFEEVEVTYRPAKAFREKEIRQVSVYDRDDHKNEIYRQIIFSQRVNDEWFEITVSKPLEGTKLVIRTIAYSTLIILLIIICISIVLNRILLKKLWSPFYGSMKEIEKFKLGEDFSPELPDSNISEFALLNSILMKVVQGAKDEYRILKEFTENASHETQTPLAIIRSKLDLVIQDESLTASQSEALNSAYEALSRLAKLNQSLLLLAKIENHQFAATAHIDLRERMEDKLQQFSEVWSANGITVESDLKPATINANPELVEILVNNLLSNAGRHNKAGGTIVVKLSQGQLSVANTGMDQPLNAEKIFKRFYKESGHSKHNGLGLSIINQISGQTGTRISYRFDERMHIFSFSWS